MSVNLYALVLSAVQIQKKNSAPAPKCLDFREMAADWWGNKQNQNNRAMLVVQLMSKTPVDVLVSSRSVFQKQRVNESQNSG